MKVAATLSEAVLLVALGLIAVGSVLFFAAAWAGSRYLHCAEWPEAGNCSDARGTMWLTGPAALISLAGAALIVSRGLKT